MQSQSALDSGDTDRREILINSLEYMRTSQEELTFYKDFTESLIGELLNRQISLARRFQQEGLNEGSRRWSERLIDRVWQLEGRIPPYSYRRLSAKAHQLAELIDDGELPENWCATGFVQGN
jgi:hypothetical protein